MNKHAGQLDEGFTIIELLIATLIASIIMLLFTTGIIQITRIYYKGVTSNTTQSVSRNIVNTLTQAIQFSNGDVSQSSSGGWNYLCVGNLRFSYQLGEELTNGSPGTYQATQALLQDTYSGAGNSCPASSQTEKNQAKELLGSKMRLSELNVSSMASDLWSVTAGVAYGDNDLLCNPNVANSCISNGAMGSLNDYIGQLQCKDGTGDQFCWASNFNTVVQQRFTNN